MSIEGRDLQAARDLFAAKAEDSPVVIQSFGAVIAFTDAEGAISHVSENVSSVTGTVADTVLNAPVKAVLPADLTHALQNARARWNFDRKRFCLGRFSMPEGMFDVAACASGAAVIAEFEAAAERPRYALELVEEVNSIIEILDKADDYHRLCDLIAETLRHVAGYDRAVVYRYDDELRGEAAAEARSTLLDTFLGARFPHRDAAGRIPDERSDAAMRFIADIDAPQVEILKAPDASELDLSKCALRGFTALRRRHLIAKGARSSLTLPLTVEGRIWGLVALQSRRARTPSSYVRQVCEALLPIVAGRIALFETRAQLKRLRAADDLAGMLTHLISGGSTRVDAVRLLAGDILSLFSADHLTLRDGEEQFTHGASLSPDEAKAMFAAAQRAPSGVATPDRLAGEGRVLALGLGQAACLFLFRKEREEEVRWFGALAEEFEVKQNALTLKPAATPKLHTEIAPTLPRPWSPSVYALAERLRDLLAMADERRGNG